jgi:hypothetical protein
VRPCGLIGASMVTWTLDSELLASQVTRLVWPLLGWTSSMVLLHGTALASPTSTSVVVGWAPGVRCAARVTVELDLPCGRNGHRDRTAPSRAELRPESIATTVPSNRPSPESQVCHVPSLRDSPTASRSLLCTGRVSSMGRPEQSSRLVAPGRARPPRRAIESPVRSLPGDSCALATTEAIGRWGQAGWCGGSARAGWRVAGGEPCPRRLLTAVQPEA